MPDPKVTFAQLRAAAKAAGCGTVTEMRRGLHSAVEWYVPEYKGTVEVWAWPKQRARKLALRVLRGMVAAVSDARPLTEHDIAERYELGATSARALMRRIPGAFTVGLGARKKWRVRLVDIEKWERKGGDGWASTSAETCTTQAASITAASGGSLAPGNETSPPPESSRESLQPSAPLLRIVHPRIRSRPA